MLTFPDRAFDDPLCGFVRQVLPESLRGAFPTQFPFQERGLQCLESIHHVQPPHLRGRDFPTPDRDRPDLFRSRTHARQGPFEIVGGDASRSIEFAILFIGQVPVTAQQAFTFANGFVKGKIFQAVHGILGHHDLHGPKGWDRFAGFGDRLSDLPPFFLGERLYRRGVHDAD